MQLETTDPRTAGHGRAPADAHDRDRLIRSVALPVEHGAWGFLLEPLGLGLLLAPSAPGACLAIAASAAFLARHPFKLVWADRARTARYDRTAWAEGFGLVYGITAAAALTVAAALAPAAFWAPLGLAVVLALVQFAYDTHHRGRELAPELAGAVALAAVLPVILLADGWPARSAGVAWALMAGRAGLAIVYVRTRLRLDRGVPARGGLVVAAHAAAAALTVALAAGGLAPWLAAAAFLLLLGRAAHGLSARRGRVRPQVIGVREMACGVATVLLLAIGYWLGV